MAEGHKRKRSCSQDGLEYEHSRPRLQSSLQTKITQTIENHQYLYPLSEYSTSECLMQSFIKHIWPEIRNAYSEMTRWLEGELKRVLQAQRIHAEVSSRVKDDASIEKTLKRRQEVLLTHRGSGFNSFQEIFHEMHDLSGLRIVLDDRGDRNKVQDLIERLFHRQKAPAHFNPHREVGQFWRKPWFGAYETNNHRVQLPNDSREFLRQVSEFSGVMFEIQLTTFSNNLYNKLAHDLLYKADAGLVTGLEEMVIDVSHGLASCFELCMKILRPKLHRDTDNRADYTEEHVGEHTEEEVRLAQSVVNDFEKDLNDRSESDRTAQLLRKLLDKKEDAEDQACLRDLFVSDPRLDKVRIEDTKGGLLPSSNNWILGDYDFQQWREDGQNRPFWITGDPGKGKTMMLCGIINGLSEELDTNVSYFFCQGTDERINTGTAVLRGLLFLLCKRQHSLISHIRHKYDDAGGKVFEGTNSWYALCQIFDNTLGDSGLRHTYLIVDALDECLPDFRQLLMGLIVRTAKSHSNVKWIVSSRGMEEFNMHLQSATHLPLESRGESVYATVKAYVDFKLTTRKLSQKNLSASEWERITSELKRKSEGTFLWVSIVCKALEEAPEYDVMDILQEMPIGLNELYGKVVQGIKSLRRNDPKYCQSVLRSVAVAFRPLTLKELQALADLPRNVPVDTIAKKCRSLLTIRDNTVFFVHQSAKDYLSNEWDNIFQSSMRHTHESMFSRSVSAMEGTLKQDIYGLAHPGVFIEDIQRPSEDLLVPIEYSCVYWIAHLRQSQPCPAEDEVYGFLKVHFLHWLEALSLIRTIPAGLYALRDLVALCKQGARLEQPLLHLASDMYRFARYNAEIIRRAPLQTYSVLIFTPAGSLTRTTFASKEPDWIVQKPRVGQNWDSCLTTIAGDLGGAHSIVFSPDGGRVVSGSHDGTIRIWDAESGANILTLLGHTDIVWSVAFDEYGKSITSRSNLVTKTWDAVTGDCLSTCEGTELPGAEVFFSPDKRRYAENTLRSGVSIKDSASHTEVLRLPSLEVQSLDFSLDGRLIVTGSYDTNVQIWDAVTGALISSLQGRHGDVVRVCFSPDGQHIASAYCNLATGFKPAIKIWDVESSVGVFAPPEDPIYCAVCAMALSLDGSRIAFRSHATHKITIWDTRPGHNFQTKTIECRADFFHITFSPDGRGIAVRDWWEDSVVIFDAESGAEIKTCKSGAHHPFALSLDCRYIATCSNNTVTIISVESDQEVAELVCQGTFVVRIAFSPKVCHLVATLFSDKTIKLWNVVDHTEIWTLGVFIRTHVLKFDSTGEFLDTDAVLPLRESMRLSNFPPLHTDIVLPQLRQLGYGLSKDSTWITWHGENILWLPPEFRRDSGPWARRDWDILPHMISIGCPSGLVWWLEFSSQNHPFALKNRRGLEI